LFAAGGALLAVFAARILLRVGTQILNPVLPLFVQALLPPEARVATATGLITGANAVGTALGSSIIGRWGDRCGHCRLLIASGLAAALFAADLNLPLPAQNVEYLLCLVMDVERRHVAWSRGNVDMIRRLVSTAVHPAPTIKRTAPRPN